MNLPAFKELQYRINPGNIDLYQACFGAEGIVGELIATLDKKVHEILKNRIRMGLPAIEV